jgi:hypothetical protein
VDYREWQLKRRDLQAREIAERSGNLESARAPLQVAITEQAIRELFDRVIALENRPRVGRPPKSEAE